MALEIQTGNPPVEGRYVIWKPCAARQIREWCEPAIATWQDGRWHSFEPVWAWIGPLPVVHGNDCLKLRDPVDDYREKRGTGIDEFGERIEEREFDL